MTKKELFEKYEEFKAMYKTITDELVKLVDEHPRYDDSRRYIGECIREANDGFEHIKEWLDDTYLIIEESLLGLFFFFFARMFYTSYYGNK